MGKKLVLVLGLVLYPAFSFASENPFKVQLEKSLWNFFKKVDYLVEHDFSAKELEILPAEALSRAKVKPKKPDYYNRYMTRIVDKILRKYGRE